MTCEFTRRRTADGSRHATLDSLEFPGREALSYLVGIKRIRGESEWYCLYSSVRTNTAQIFNRLTMGNNSGALFVADIGSTEKFSEEYATGNGNPAMMAVITGLLGQPVGSEIF